MLMFLRLDVTKNLEYDRLTIKIMNRTIKSTSNCIDIGCHKGEILDIILKLAPNGKQFGFEPIPAYYKLLKQKYSTRATIYPFALAAHNGPTTFQFVKNAPAYSGIKKRKYDIDNPEIEEINVELKKLDDVFPSGIAVDFIKIDVEGAELGVLQGAKNILLKNKPVIIFEFGLGASDFYNTKPADIYNLLVDEIGLQIYTLKGWLANDDSLSLVELENLFNSGEEYYFIASKK
jgi:FkbM family methyltransferase